jgi:hypothetical protein
MKILALDIDGVLNSAQWFTTQKAKGWLGLAELDPEAVKRVHRVIEVTGCEILLSSTWRLVPDFVTLLRTVGGLTINHFTPRLDDGHRASEIMAWLNKHRLGDGTLCDIESFAIVDDDADAGDHPLLTPRFVRTDWNFGIQDSHVERLIKLLGSK